MFQENNEQNQRWFRTLDADSSTQVWLTGRGTTRSVIKQEHALEEYNGWKQIRGYINVLPTKLAVLDDTPTLVIEHYPSINLGDLIAIDPERAYQLFEMFMDDTTQMWLATKQEYKPEALRKDYSRLHLNELPTYKSMAVQRLGVINTDIDQEVQQFFTTLEDAFQQTPGSIILAHGDEHLGNILAPSNIEGEDEYRVIDARYAGYNDPACVLANIYARLLFFNTTYLQDAEILSNHTSDGAIPDSISNQSEVIGRMKNLVLSTLDNFAEDGTIKLRMAGYVGYNIGRSIAYLREPSFEQQCRDFGIAHFLTAMDEVKKILASA